MNDNKNSMKGTAVPTFEYKADAATPCLTLIPAPVTLEYTHGTAMIGSLVTIEKRIPEYAVTEDADETWETLPIEQLSSELERYCGVAVRTRRVLTATDEADAGANAAEKARDAGVGAGAGAGAGSGCGEGSTITKTTGGWGCSSVFNTVFTNTATIAASATAAWSAMEQYAPSLTLLLSAILFYFRVEVQLRQVVALYGVDDVDDFLVYKVAVGPKAYRGRILCLRQRRQ